MHSKTSQEFAKLIEQEYKFNEKWLIKNLKKAQELLKELSKDFTQEEIESEDCCLDIRLQCLVDEKDLNNYEIIFHYGDSQYDTDHTGFWSYNLVTLDEEEDDLQERASDLYRDLINAIYLNQY